MNEDMRLREILSELRGIRQSLHVVRCLLFGFLSAFLGSGITIVVRAFMWALG